MASKMNPIVPMVKASDTAFSLKNPRVSFSFSTILSASKRDFAPGVCTPDGKQDSADRRQAKCLLSIGNQTFDLLAQNLNGAARKDIGERRQIGIHFVEICEETIDRNDRGSRGENRKQKEERYASGDGDDAVVGNALVKFQNELFCGEVVQDDSNTGRPLIRCEIAPPTPRTDCEKKGHQSCGREPRLPIGYGPRAGMRHQ